MTDLVSRPVEASPGGPKVGTTLQVAKKFVKEFHDGAKVLDVSLNMGVKEAIEKLHDGRDKGVMYKVHSSLGDKNINIESWTPQGDGEIRKLTFVRDLDSPLYKKKGMEVTEIHYFERTDDKGVMTSSSYNPEVPYGQTFEVNVCSVVTGDSKNSQLVVRAKIVWLKNCAVKSIITSFSTKEVKDFWKKIAGYLKRSPSDKTRDREGKPVASQYLPRFKKMFGGLNSVLLILIIFLLVRKQKNTSAHQQQQEISAFWKLVIIGIIIFMRPSPE